LLELVGQAGHLRPQGIDLILRIRVGSSVFAGCGGGGFPVINSPGFQLHLLPEESPLPLKALGRILREQGAKDLAPLYDQALAQPGLKVMHAVDVDFRSHCPTFRLCLQQVRAWSDANPGHSPVFILLEPKFQSLAAFAPGATPLDPFDARAFSRSLVGLED
jgi:hypothetical protein